MTSYLFLILLSINECLSYNTIHGSNITQFLQTQKLIIWNDTSMSNKYCFEASCRILRNILRSKNLISLNKSFRKK